MAVVLGLLTGLTWYKGSWSFPYLLVLSIGFLTVGLVRPTLLKQVYLAWMTLAVTMGYFVTRIILTALFFGVFGSAGLVLRLVKKDMLDQRYEPEADTYWKPYSKPQDPRQRLERQF